MRYPAVGTRILMPENPLLLAMAGIFSYPAAGSAFHCRSDALHVFCRSSPAVLTSGYKHTYSAQAFDLPYSIVLYRGTACPLMPCSLSWFQPLSEETLLFVNDNSIEISTTYFRYPSSLLFRMRPFAYRLTLLPAKAGICASCSHYGMIAILMPAPAGITHIVSSPMRMSVMVSLH